MTSQDAEYAELLLAWARNIDKHRLSFDEYCSRYQRVTIHQAERTAK